MNQIDIEKKVYNRCDAFNSMAHSNVMENALFHSKYAAVTSSTSESSGFPFIAVHGGCNLRGELLDDLNVFVPSISEWQRPQGNQKPTPRMMHSICWTPSPVALNGGKTAHIYLYGGINSSFVTLSDFYRFEFQLQIDQHSFFSSHSNVLHGEWRQLECAQGQPPAMVGHSLTVRPCNGDIILFGGLSALQMSLHQIKSSGPYLSDKSSREYLWAWGGHNGWKALPIQNPAGIVPKRRSGHAAAVIENKLYIFGGEDAEYKLLNDLWEYDFTRMGWRRISNYFEKIRPGAYLSEVSVHHRFWVIISCDVHTRQLSVRADRKQNTLHVQVYDMVNESWIQNIHLNQKCIYYSCPSTLCFAMRAKSALRECDVPYSEIHHFKLVSAIHPNGSYHDISGTLHGRLLDHSKTTSSEIDQQSQNEKAPLAALCEKENRKILRFTKHFSKKTSRKYPSRRVVTRKSRNELNTHLIGADREASQITCSEQMHEKEASKKEDDWMQQFAPTMDFGDSNVLMRFACVD